jgi:hypothetical protein
VTHIASSNGAVFVSMNNGRDRKSGVDAVNQAGLRFGQSIVDEKNVFSSFDQQINVSKAVQAAQSGVKSFIGPWDKGDVVSPRVLGVPKRRK